MQVIQTPHKVVSATLVGNEMHVVRQYPSHARNCFNGASLPDLVVKEVYAPVDGVLTKIKEIQGTHTPAYQVAESIRFPEEQP